MKKIVIFDMDGTLIDSKKDITVSINYVRAKNHALPPLKEEFVAEAINMHERNLSKLFYNTKMYEQHDKEVFEKHYKQQCIKNSKLYDGIYELLSHLQAQGVCMGVATNAPTHFATIMLQHLNVAHFFTSIVGSNDVKVSKPDPQMLYNILDRCQYDKNIDSAWMVGDNPKDIEAAYNASINGVFVTWGFSKECHSASSIIQTPNELLSVIGCDDEIR